MPHGIVSASGIYINTPSKRLASQSPFRTRSSTAHCAPAVPVTGTTSQHRFARCDSVASSRDDSTPRSDARFVSPLALTHVGYTVSPRGFRGLTASAFSLPWRSANDVETCRACGGTTKVIACIEDRVVIEKILAHLQGKDTSVPTNLLPASRAPPADLFG